MHKSFSIKIGLYKCIFLLLFSVRLYGQQSIENYVRNNTFQLKGDESDSSNNSDLEIIGNAIGDARIVFLGEQDHGDAPTFLAKTRIIKYLHEKKEFDIIAFESDFFSLTFGWDQIPKNEYAINSYINGNIYGLWTYCNACDYLFHKYIPNTYNTKNPLVVTGFDNQLILSYSYKNLFSKYDSIIKYYKLPITLLSNYSSEIFPLITSIYHINEPGLIEDSITYDKRDAALLQIKNQLSEKIDTNNYWMVITNNLISLNLEYKYSNKTNYWKSSNVRDDQMAKNLKWLCENKYPNKKIIVWAANYHISKYNSHYPEEFLNNAKTMGGVFTADSAWNAKTYIMGFTSYGGEAGRLMQKKYTVPKPKNNSFENWIPPKINLSFTNFKEYNTNNPNAHNYFFMSGSIKGTGFHSHHEAEWNRIFDGVFFIRTMYPCEKIK